MPNVLMTARCNRKCSFCFAKKRTSEMISNKKDPLNISKKNIQKVKTFATRSGKKELRLLGGEPTIHPKFIEIVEESLADGFYIHVFTNGIMPKKVADFLAGIPHDNISVLCNVSPQSRDSESQNQRRLYAFERLDKRMILGITITSVEFEFEFLIELIRRYNLKKSIRIGMAQPIVGHDNEFLDPSDYHKIGRPIIKMARACVREDILIGFDCGMTMCMFTEEEFGTLTMISQGFRSLCSPIIDIGPNLDLWNCFPLSEVYNSHLEKFQNFEEAKKCYSRLMAPYQVLGCMPKCLECEYKRREQCSGGCIAHTMNSLNRQPQRYI